MRSLSSRRCRRRTRRLEAAGRWSGGEVVSIAADQGRETAACAILNIHHNMERSRDPMKVIGMAGWSGSGKTTLVEQLIPHFTARGLRVSVIKHAHHGFDLDKPGKDSYRHREAGAVQVLMLSNDRWVLMHELRGAPEPTLDEQLRLLAPCDLVLIEGYKEAAVPKIEIHRPALGKPPLWPDNPHVIAVASDADLECPLPRLPLNDPATIAAFILDRFNML